MQNHDVRNTGEELFEGVTYKVYRLLDNTYICGYNNSISKLTGSSLKPFSVKFVSDKYSFTEYERLYWTTELDRVLNENDFETEDTYFYYYDSHPAMPYQPYHVQE